jgi:O-antigen/teichoic acid export membrane protein
MKRALSLSVVDQAVLSIQSLLIGLLLVQFADSHEVGRYALSMSVFFALLTVQDSLFCSIISNRVFGAAADEQAWTIGIISSVSAIYFIAIAIIATVLVAVWLSFEPTLIAAAVTMVASGLLREFARSVSISLNNLRRCLLVDIVSVLLTVAVLSLTWRVVDPAAACLLAIAAGHGAAVVVLTPQMHVNLKNPVALMAAYGPYFNITRWNLAAGLAEEIRSRTFLFLIDVLRGISATAAIHVGRLFISPVLLITMAVGRIVVPRIANRMRLGDIAGAQATILQVTAMLFMLGLAYSVLIYVAWPVLEDVILRGRYPAIAETMAAWCAFTLFSTLLSPLQWLYRAIERFRELAYVSSVNAAIVLAAMTSLAISQIPLQTAIVILAIGNFSSAAALLWMLKSRPISLKVLS